MLTRTCSMVSVLALSLLLTQCKKSEGDLAFEDGPSPKNGYVTGKAVNAEGKPLAGAKVYIDNTLYYNSGVSMTTDASGTYKIRIPVGSAYKAYAEIGKEYHGNFFKIELDPSSADSFTEEESVVRNFTWKMSGEKPSFRNTFYGGEVQLYQDPNSAEAIPVEEVEFTFTPDGALIDGSTGKTLVRQSSGPRTNFYSKIMDVPIGRYRITAKHKPTGRQLLVQDGSDYRNPFESSVTLDFYGEDSPFSCNNCMKVNYREP